MGLFLKPNALFPFGFFGTARAQRVVSEGCPDGGIFGHTPLQQMSALAPAAVLVISWTVGTLSRMTGDSMSH